MTEHRLQVVYHDQYLTDYPTASCETPERVASIISVLRAHFEVVEPAPATEVDILRVHSSSLLQSVQDIPSVYTTALMAAGGAIKASEIAMTGIPCFAAVRPPGHHASPSSNWGFCFFNNVAVAVERLIRTERITSALILDIDLHYGDGTANFFTGRRDVAVVNIQDSDRENFLANVDRALASREYDIVAVSAGFDRHRQDWGGTLTTEDYYSIGFSVKSYSQAKCGGRCFAVLEGGYNIDVLGDNALALCNGLDA
ncbi:MAG: histone deacetylase family protein [Desulfomonilaceae bacterium]